MDAEAIAADRLVVRLRMIACNPVEVTSHTASLLYKAANRIEELETEVAILLRDQGE